MISKLLAVFLSTFAIGCTHGTTSPSGGAQDVAEPSNSALKGRVLYEARHPKLTGASKNLELRPARSVDLQVVSETGEVLETGATNNEGGFELTMPKGRARLVVVSQIKSSGFDVAVTVDREGSTPHRMEVSLEGISRAEPLEVIATDAAEGGPAGTFHILDTMAVGLAAAERWTGRKMPPIFVYWGRGVTQSWSYYRGELPQGSGRYGFELLGGQLGQQLTTPEGREERALIEVHLVPHDLPLLYQSDVLPKCATTHLRRTRRPS